MNENLVAYLKKCDDAYYNTSNPIVSDDTYDALVETLRRLDPKHPYLQKVGAKVRSNKVGRVVPMGTLSKYHTLEDVVKWLNSEDDEWVLLSPKYDGFAVELVYDTGRLVSASTRGTGVVGEDVLSSMMKVHNVPLNMEGFPEGQIVIRGEVIIPTKNHEKVKELGYTAMRNAVPGIVRSNRTDALMYVDFVAYEFLDDTKDRVSQREYWKQFFTVEDYRLFKKNDLENISKRREELRSSEYSYELDGVVLKTRTVKDDDLLNPSHMIAWKYKSNRETTILRGVDFQMGVTGYFTPIGIFDEVEFQGAKLTRASLGNVTRLINEFEGMTIGSIVEVSRRGDIIPYIEALALVDEHGEKIESPTVCPHCGQPLAYKDKEPHCANKSCPEKLRLQITQYARAIGVKGIGDKLVSGLIDAGHLKSITDIYHIDPEVILNIPRQGQSSVEKWKALQDKKLSPLELLSSYPFLDLGKKIWESVLSKFSYSEILDITRESLESAKLRGIGDSKIESIVSQVEENRSELEHLMTIHF